MALLEWELGIHRDLIYGQSEGIEIWREELRRSVEELLSPIKMDKPQVWRRFGDEVHFLAKTPFFRRNAKDTSEALPDFALDILH